MATKSTRLQRKTFGATKEKQNKKGPVKFRSLNPALGKTSLSGNGISRPAFQECRAPLPRSSVIPLVEHRASRKTLLSFTGGKAKHGLKLRSGHCFPLRLLPYSPPRQKYHDGPRACRGERHECAEKRRMKNSKSDFVFAWI